MNLYLEMFIILLFTAASSSILGNYLFLKENLVVADAISHTILLGIVIAYFFTKNLYSPLLFIFAVIFAILTVYLIELLSYSQKMKYDAAMGLVFPFFFATAVILISKYFAGHHLDLDAVLLGHIELAPLKRIILFKRFNVSQALLVSGLVLLINIVYSLIIGQKIKVRLFDETQAKILGLKVFFLDLSLMILVAITSVTSFNHIGIMLVINFMASPAMTARCLTHKYPQFIRLSILIAIINACLGFGLAYFTNSSIAALTAWIGFINFLLVFIWKRRKIHKIKEQKVSPT